MMDTNVQYLASVLEKLPPDDGRLLLQFAEFLVEKQPRTISAHEARRQVSAWLVHEVGNLLMGGQPELVRGDRPVWRVPVLITRGQRSQAGSVDVDARTGKLLIDESAPDRILSHVQTTVGNTPPS